MSLTNLQKDVLTLVVREESNCGIADALNISVPYVKKILQSLFKYYNVKTRSGLVREAVKDALLSEYFSQKK